MKASKNHNLSLDIDFEDFINLYKYVRRDHNFF